MHKYFDMNNGEIDPHTLAVMFRNPEDAKIAEIFAEADLKGVGNGFYESHCENLESSIEIMQNAIKELYKTGNMIFPTRILNSDKLQLY